MDAAQRQHQFSNNTTCSSQNWSQPTYLGHAGYPYDCNNVSVLVVEHAMNIINPAKPTLAVIYGMGIL